MRSANRHLGGKVRQSRVQMYGADLVLGASTGVVRDDVGDFLRDARESHRTKSYTAGLRN